MAGPAAIGGDAEVVDEALRRDDPGPGAQLAVRRMEQPEVQPRLGSERELGQGLEEPQVRSPATGRWSQSSDRLRLRERALATSTSGWAVGAIAVVRLVAVTEVVAELHARRDAAAQADQPLDDAGRGRRTTRA